MNNILTDEDIAFLKALGTELATQDTLATAKPVYFTITEADIEIGIDEDFADGACVIFDDKVCTDLEEAKEYLIETYPEHDADRINDIESMIDLRDYCDSNCIDVTYTGYKEVTNHKGMFLTRKALKEHVNANRHHYKNANNYCHHAWRNPELEKLLDIVKKFADKEVVENGKG